MTEVVLVTAAWCKRCHVLKPDIMRLCAATGVAFSIIDYDELEENNPIKVSVTALPTIRMQKSGSSEWKNYTPNEIEQWRTEITALPIAITGDDNF